MGKAYWRERLESEVDFMINKLDKELEPQRQETTGRAAIEKLRSLGMDMQDIYEKWKMAAAERDDAEAQYKALKKKTDRLQELFFREGDISSYYSTTPTEWLKGQVRGEVNEELLAETEQGKEITRLRGLKSKIAPAIERASTDKKVIEAVDALAAAIGITLDPE